MKPSVLLSMGVGCGLLGWAAAQEPPLPSWDEEGSELPGVSLTPEPGALPPPPLEAGPTELPPVEQIPDLPPLLPPSDGVEIPPIPEMPGVVMQDSLPKPPVAKVVDESKGRLDEISSVKNHWMASPREARQLSIKTGRPMLMLVGGFGWSPSCKALNNDVFTDADLKGFLQERAVLTFLNVTTERSSTNPERQAKLTEVRRFREYLRITRLPTVIVFDAEGLEIDRMTGYGIGKVRRPLARQAALERIPRVIEEAEKRAAAKARARKLLTEVQGYRTWTSRKGTTLFAKVVRLCKIPAPTERDSEAVEDAAEFMDENGGSRIVALRHLTMVDREIAERIVESRGGKSDSAPPPKFEDDAKSPASEMAADKSKSKS